MNRRSHFSVFSAVLGLVMAVCVIGCHHDDPNDAPVTGTQPDVNTDKSVQPPKSAEGTKIITSPSQAQPGEAVTLRPPNPNDPHFKPDPKLASGGGSGGGQ